MGNAGFIWGFSENRGPQYSTLNSSILIIIYYKDPKIRYPNFRKVPYHQPYEHDPKRGPGLRHQRRRQRTGSSAWHRKLGLNRAYRVYRVIGFIGFVGFRAYRV